MKAKHGEYSYIPCVEIMWVKKTLKLVFIRLETQTKAAVSPPVTVTTTFANMRRRVGVFPGAPRQISKPSVIHPHLPSYELVKFVFLAKSFY
jgi:hypothetical protein